MIKKFIYIFCGLSLYLTGLNLVSADAAAEVKSQIDQQQEKTFFGTLSEIKKFESTLSKSEIDLKYLIDDFENEYIGKIAIKQEEISNHRQKLLEIARELDDHKKDPENDPSLPDMLAKEEKSIEEKIAKLEEEINTLVIQKEEVDKQHEQEIETTQKEIKTIKSEIEKLKEVAQNQFIELAKKIGLFIGLIAMALLSRKIAIKTILSHGKTLPKKRQEILIKITNITVGTLIAIAVFAALFAQFFIILPFLALLGTGLAFAVRDVISSFIAWFFIGAKHGYKIGDLIEVGEARGRVLDIHLIHTIIQETGVRGPSGKIVTVPNKKMFETEIKNFSAMFRFTWVMFDFLLEKNSNVQKVKTILLEIINEFIKEDLDDISKNLPSLARKYNFSEETVRPHIFVDLEEKGIRINVKFFCRLPQRHSLRSEISEKFLERILHEKDVNLRFINF